MKYILVLLIHVYGGDEPAVISPVYENAAACEAAGKVWDREGGLATVGRYHVCIPAPTTMSSTAPTSDEAGV